MAQTPTPIVHTQHRAQRQVRAGIGQVEGFEFQAHGVAPVVASVLRDVCFSRRRLRRSHRSLRLCCDRGRRSRR